MPRSTGEPVITDILFDLGNVLVPVRPDTAFRRLLPHLPPDRAALLARDRPAFLRLFDGPKDALETGKIDFPEFCRRMSFILGVFLPIDEFRSIWCSMFSMDSEMIALGERLSTRYRTWLASNTSRVHYESIRERFPRVLFYRDAALSFELGVMKPDPEYYARAVKKFGIDPRAAVFIDDLSENVDGAIRSGLHGITFTGRLQLVRELAELGVQLPGNGA